MLNAIAETSAPMGGSHLWDRCTDFFRSLFELFSKTVDSLLKMGSNRQLHNHRITLGGVENIGNSCIISTMLQEFASEPEFYDLLLTYPLQQDNGEPSRYQLRLQVQQHLLTCVQKIRAGKRVYKSDVCTLSGLLQKLGWNGRTETGWHLILNRIAPQLFPASLFSPFELYELVLAILLSDESAPSHHLVLMAKKQNTTIKNLIENSACKMDGAILWKIATDRNEVLRLEEAFQLEDRLFSLKQVHVCRPSLLGNHVVLYRKYERGWICCDDISIYPVDAPPSTGIYTLLYESG